METCIRVEGMKDGRKWAKRYISTMTPQQLKEVAPTFRDQFEAEVEGAVCTRIDCMEGTGFGTDNEIAKPSSVTIFSLDQSQDMV